MPTGPLTSLPLSVLVTETPKGGAAADADPQALRDTPWLIKRHAMITLPSVSSLKALRAFARNFRMIARQGAKLAKKDGRES